MANKKPQFRLSSLLFVTLLAALIVGWVVTANITSRRFDALEGRVQQLEERNRDLLKQQLSELNSELAVLQGRYLDSHPMVYQKRQEIALIIRELKN